MRPTNGPHGRVPWLIDTIKARNDDEEAIIALLAALASPELRTTVRSLVSDQALADILISRLDEVEAAHNAGAFVLAVVGTGSFIEGLLHDVMRLRDPEIRKAESTSLDLLLRSAHKRG